MKVWNLGIFIVALFICQVNANIPEEPKPHPECPTGPSEDVEHPVHLVYPGNCKKFYKCLKGSAYPHDCPGGLYWSHNTISCLYAGEEKPLCPF